jgi:two-component system, NtrC family, response regulator AtoC
MASILIVDDEINIFKSFNSLLSPEHDVYSAINSTEALSKIKNNRIDLVFLDYNLGGENGFDLIKAIKEVDFDLYIVMISAYGNFEIIIQAMALGCYDYLEKPLDIDKITILLKRALRSKRISNTVKFMINEQSNHFNLNRIIGKSLPMQSVFKQIGLLLNTNVTVLITGENGTGKELIARALHYSGSFREEPFVAVNCSGLTESLLDNELFGHEPQAYTGADSRVKGKFETAGEGTIFLDEIGEMPLTLQAKLLRVLQEKEFHRLGGSNTIKLKARIITATNKNIIEETASGRFRQDLFFRINVAQIQVPPLRNRKEDIPVLLDYFVKEANLKLNKKVESVSEESLKILSDYDWPGNVREFENTITNICINTHGVIIRSGSIPDYIKTKMFSTSSNADIENFLRTYLETANCDKPLLPSLIPEIEGSLIRILQIKYGDNKTKIASALGISRVTLLKKINNLNL